MLAACGEAANVGSDGYRFEAPEYERQTVIATVHYYESLDALRAAHKGKNSNDDRELMAWGVIFPNDIRCEIHAMNPKKVYAPEWIGHEFTHCIHGRWHK